MEAFMNITGRSYFLLATIGLGMIVTPSITPMRYTRLQQKPHVWGSSSNITNLTTTEKNVLLGAGVIAAVAAIIYYVMRSNVEEETITDVKDQTPQLSTIAAPTQRPFIADFYTTTPLHGMYSDHFPVLAPSDSSYAQAASQSLHGFGTVNRYEVTHYNDHFPVLSY